MNPRTKRLMDIVNNRLLIYGQQTKISNLSKLKVELNSGQILYNNEALNFIRRIMNLKTEEWVKNTDNLLAGRVTPEQIKAPGHANGGRACMAKHGNRITEARLVKGPWNKGKGGYRTVPCSEDKKKKIGEKNLGQRNGMYGVKTSDEEKKHKSELMKQKILNGEFTPNTNNRLTHFDVFYDNLKFRSSWEAVFHQLNPNFEYEKLRLKYTYLDKEHIYIVDFICHETKCAVEVKPKELLSSGKMKAKLECLNRWANENNYLVKIFTQDDIREQFHLIKINEFDTKTKRLIEQFSK